MRAYLFFLSFFPLISLNLSAQISWQETYGGSSTDQGSAVCSTADGGYLLASNVRSVDGDITNKTTADTLDYDIWLAKSNSTGTIEWSKAYGGTKDDMPDCIVQTADGGYILTGTTLSGDGDFTGTGFHGNTDIFLLKLDSQGNKQWLKCYGGTGYESGFNVIENTEGNFLVAGMTYNSGSSGDLSGTSSRGWTDAFILKLSSTGTIIWKQRYGGNLDDRARDMVEMEDGGYIFACEAESYSGSGEVNVNLGNNHTYDFWILRLNSSGQIQWKKNFGGTSHERPGMIRRLADGNFIIVGFTSSSNMDAAGNHGGSDGFIVKMDPDGNKLWSRTIGGSADDYLEDILVLNDTSFMVTGYAASSDGDLEGNHGSTDGWVAQMNYNGDLRSSIYLGSSGPDRLLELDLLKNKQVVVTGFAGASDGDVSAVDGAADIWVLKLGDSADEGNGSDDPLEEELMAYWPFNGNANDESGSGLNGEVFGALPANDRFGHSDQALYFDGLDDYVRIPHAEVLNRDSLTISLWVKLHSYISPSTDRFIIGKGDDATGLSWRIYHQGVGPQDTASLVTDAFFPGREVIAKPVQADSWHHIVLQYQGAGGSMQTYVDNELVDYKILGGNISKSNQDLVVGARLKNGVIQDFCQGWIDDIRIYEKILSPGEITSLFKENYCYETVYDTVYTEIFDTIRVEVADCDCNSCPELIQILGDRDASFPSSIAVSGNLAVISAGWETTENYYKGGAVYVFEKDGETWQEKQRLISPYGKNDGIFGHTVATDGTYLVVCEPGPEQAHFYRRTNGIWKIDTTFTITEDGTERFGISCAIEDGTIAIGSGAVFAGMCNAVGSIYVFEHNGSEWSFRQRLVPENGQPHDNFASNLAISNGHIVAGAAKSDCYQAGKGYVCVFEKSGGVWGEVQRLTSPSGVANDNFGYTVDLEGDRLVVGARGDGAAYYYENKGQWELCHTLSPDESADNFGWPVKINNDLVIVGEYRDSEIAPFSGAVHLYKTSGDDVIHLCKLKAETPVEDGGFGYGWFDSDNNVLFANAGYSIPEVDIYKLTENYFPFFDTTLATLYDTVKVVVKDTIWVTVQDTVYVTITDSIAVTDTLFIDVELTDLASPFNLNTIKVYPNPARDHLYISTGNFGLIYNYRITIFDQRGGIVFETFMHDFLYEVDLSDWSGPGVYYLQLFDEEENIVDIRKIVLY